MCGKSREIRCSLSVLLDMGCWCAPLLLCVVVLPLGICPSVPLFVAASVSLFFCSLLGSLSLCSLVLVFHPLIPSIMLSLQIFPSSRQLFLIPPPLPSPLSLPAARGSPSTSPHQCTSWSMSFLTFLRHCHGR